MAIYSENDPQPIFRDVLKYNQQLKTLTLLQTLPQGSCLVQMTQPVTEEILRSSKQAYLSALSDYPSHHQPDALLWFSCVTRRQLLEKSVTSEYQYVSRIASNIDHQIPTAGFYVYGEIAPKNKQTGIADIVYHSSALIVLAMGEADSSILNQQAGDEYSHPFLLAEIERLNKKNSQLQQDKEIHEDSRNSLGQLRADRTHHQKAIQTKDTVIKALTCLLNKGAGRLPVNAIKGTGQVNKNKLATLLLEQITENSPKTDIKIKEIYKLL